MLAAGGHGAAVHLWDARASARASMALPLQRSAIITSVLCCPEAHTVAAGCSRGTLDTWDLRKAGRSSAHVLSGRGLAQASPAASLHLSAAAADAPTALPYAAQLRLAVGAAGAAGGLPPAEDTGVDAGAADGEGGQGGRIALARSAALAAAARPSAVESLVQGPGDMRRIAYSLACGSAGTCLPIFDPLPSPARLCVMFLLVPFHFGGLLLTQWIAITMHRYTGVRVPLLDVVGRSKAARCSAMLCLHRFTPWALKVSTEGCQHRAACMTVRLLGRCAPAWVGHSDRVARVQPVYLPATPAPAPAARGRRSPA